MSLTMAKLTGEARQRFLRERLEEQRHLLRKSIAEFSAGDLTEGVRMAVVMRVLVHEAGNSKPLLKQLTGNYLQLKILDREEDKDELPSGQRVLMAVPISLKITDDGVFLNPHLNAEAYEPSILGRWWTRPCLILPGLGGFNRREIVLGLANKEGGAHVDINLSERYRELLESNQFQIGSGQKMSPLNLSRFMTAQSAVELLDCLEKNFPP